MARVLITGAGGFIGSHLVELLVENGHEVRALLHYNSRSDRGHLARVSAEIAGSVETIWGNVRDAGSVQRAVLGREIILHLAAQVAIPYSYVNPTEFVQTNVVGTLNVLEAALSSDATERVVVTSTSEVYGSAQYLPMDEAHPLRAQSPYAASKIGADQLAASFHRSFGLPVGILRPFNTFGPRQSLRAIIPTLITQLLTQPVVRVGNVSPRRDLTFVKDTAAAFQSMMTSTNVPWGEPVNVGHGKDVSVGELFDRLQQLTGSTAELVTESDRVRPEKSEVTRLCAEASRARELLGWAPQYSLDDGLAATVAWIRAHIDEFEPTTYHI